MKLTAKLAAALFISFALMAGCNDNTNSIFTGPLCDDLVWVGRDFGTHIDCVQIYCNELDRYLEDGWTHYYSYATCENDLLGDDEGGDDEDEIDDYEVGAWNTSAYTRGRASE